MAGQELVTNRVSMAGPALVKVRALRSFLLDREITLVG
jgi:hypothetical protein